MSRSVNRLARAALWLGLCASAGLAGAESADPRALPATLDETGFFDPAVRARLVAFTPQYPLWSDGATKRRWLYLPPGTAIDASQADAWEFPRGTRLWKEFSHGGAIETRYLERSSDGAWRFGAYVWNAAGTEARLAPAEGVRDLPARAAPGGRYTIPAESDCRACHEGAPVPVLGFSALQLSPERDARAPHAEGPADPSIDLRGLVARGILRHLPPGLLDAPPRIAAVSATERAALGYLHGNCGHCHNADGPLAVLELDLSQRVTTPSDAARRSIVGVPAQLRIPGAPPGAFRIAPGHAGASALVLRMRTRDPLRQMPPLGTSLPDTHALELIAAWVDALPH